VGGASLRRRQRAVRTAAAPRSSSTFILSFYVLQAIVTGKGPIKKLYLQTCCRLTSCFVFRLLLQAIVTGKGPVENLYDHLAAPSDVNFWVK